MGGTYSPISHPKFKKPLQQCKGFFLVVMASVDHHQFALHTA
jgi:hypothetical protein